MTTAGLQLGVWESLPGGLGTQVTVSGRYSAAARPGQLTFWRDDQHLGSVAAPVPGLGRARIVEGDHEPDRVFWGPTSVDLATGELEHIEELPQIRAASAPQLGRDKQRARRAISYAWSADGSKALVMEQETGTPLRTSASATLFDRRGELIAPLWRGDDLLPIAGLVGHTLAIVGTRQPRAFRFDGRELRVFDGVTPPIRIDMTADESRMVAVESSAIRLWAIEDGRPLATAEGAWLDAAVSPDGRFVFGVDMDGSLHLLDHTLALVARPELPDRLGGIAAGPGRLLGAFAGSIRQASYQTREQPRFTP